MAQISVDKYVANVNSIYKKKPKYELGCDGSNGKCDCIGMCRGAIKKGGVTPLGLSGTNYAARYTIKNLKKITSVSQLKVGDVVLKGRPYSKNDNYPLPSRYLKGGASYNGDTTNYYHIGTVTQINPLEITHMTSPTAKKDTKLGNWNYFGQLPQVSYKKESEVVVVVEYATVTGGSLNIRKEKSTSSTKLGVIPSGAKVAVTEHGTDWCLVIYNSYTGYVMSKFLTFESGSGDSKVSITLSRENALALYEALKLSLNK
ncbi:MAG: SH3 domain-containing protein [Paludibacteraceae bacterium]|nr:SH3 domain-containing protein [Paludibacteraceae bacterium]